jgi:hypothetical protein
MKKIFLLVNVLLLLLIYFVLDIVAVFIFRTGRVLCKRLQSPMVGHMFYMIGLVVSKVCDSSEQVMDEQLEQLAC